MKQWELRGVTVDVARPARTTVVVDAPGPALRALVDQLPAVLWTTDSSLRFTSMLGAEVPKLGLGPNQMVGTSLFEMFEREDDEFPPIAAHRGALAGEVVPFRMRCGRRTYQCRVAPLHDTGGAVIGTIGVALAQARPSVSTGAKVLPLRATA